MWKRDTRRTAARWFLVLYGILALSALACGLSLFESVDTSGNLEVTGGGTITIGESRTATLDSIVEAHEWTFAGEAGQFVRALVEGQDKVDPRVTLLDPVGVVLAIANENEGPDEILSYTLPEAGTYTLRIDVFTKGTYTLTLE